MNADCKNARTFLKQATRTEYNSVVYEAKLTPEQETILNLHILEAKSIIAISMKLHCNTTHVKEKLSDAYKSIHKVIKSTP